MYGILHSTKLKIRPWGFGPFGVGGFGFTVENKPPPPTEEEVIERSKQQLQAVKEYQRRLEQGIEKMEKQKSSGIRERSC